MVDIESDGPIPGKYSMISLGAIIVNEKMDSIFYKNIKPISENFIPEAISICGFSREETLKFEDPLNSMEEFSKWIKQNSKGDPIFISDNNGYDYMFVCWYFHTFLGNNPFGYSSQNLGSLYKGLIKDTSKNFKHLRITKHTHNAVDDVKGNNEALLYMKNSMGLNISLE